MEKEKCPNCNETMEVVSVNCACPECHTMLNHVDYDFDSLAIEFADWITTAECLYAPIGENINEWVDLSKEGITIIISSKELFQEFIKQRNKA